ncbi:E3 ubiquitin-protein ligase rnf213-alpha-like isoform X3 [Oculina patagonica]
MLGKCSSFQEDISSLDEDEGQRKRKVEEQEEKPAKRKSVECEDIPVPGEAADVTASALQNLTIVRDADEKQKAVPVTTTEPPSSITALDCSPEKASDYSVQQPTATGDVIQKVDDACRESSVPKIGNTCESMSLVKAADSSDLPDVPMETEHKNGNKEDANVNLSEECKSDSALQQPGDDGQPKKEEDDNPDSDENGTDVEEDDSNGKGKETQPESRKKKKGASQRNREKKSDRKKRVEEEKRKAVQQRKLEGAGGAERQKGDDTGKNQHDNNNDHDQFEDKGKGKQDNISHTDGQERNKKQEKEYFAKSREKKMTIVFHAVLAPHFKFEKSQGDRIFMRFGGAAFGGFNDNVVEVHPERYLENDFILIQANLLVPCIYVSRKVPYKYIVFKAKRKDSKEKEKYLWDYLAGQGAMKNRCLQIPKDRCQTGAVWHQYDDTIFSPPSWFQSIRNKMPFLKSMDAVDGRNIATWAMLPRWEGFTTDEARTSMTAWEAVEVVSDIAYCMTQTQVEEDGRFTENVPYLYNFSRVLKDFFKTRIEKNALPQTEDEKNIILPLVSSVAIAYIIYTHKVYLEPDHFAKLFFSLILKSDPKEQTCTSFERLLKHFPSEQWQNLGEAIQAICRHVAKDHRDLHDWLFAVPLVHFLTQESQPFNSSVLLMETPKAKDDTWWGASGFNTKSVRERTFTEHSCPSVLMNMLSPLFELDPLFRRTFLLVVPCRAFGKVASSGRFTPVEIYTTLARVLSEKHFILEEEMDAVVTSLNVMQQQGKTQTSEIEAKEFSSAEDQNAYTQEAVLCVSSCLDILKAISSDCNFKLLCDCLHSIGAWVSVLAKTAVLDQEGKRIKKIVVESFEIVKKSLKRTFLISSKIPCYTTAETAKELEIWTKLLNIDWTNKECADIWRNHVSEAFKMRLEECDCNGLVEIFTKANMAAQHNHVQDLVSEVTFRKVEGMLQRGSEGEKVFKNLSVHGLESPQASKCGDLLTLMLTRCWPQQQGGVPCSCKAILKQVLTWRLWPCFLQRFGRESDYRRVLKEDGQEILMKAISSLEAAVGSLKDGTIEFQMLILLHDYSERFLALCGHISKEEGKLSLLRQLLHQRCVELTAFQEERDKVSIFIRMCSLIKQVNLDKLSRKAVMDASRVLIKDLAQSTIVGGKVLPVVTFFALSPKAKEMISSLSQLSDSTLLRQFWRDHGDKALKKIAERETQKAYLSVADVVELVWTPTNAQLQSLQDQFLHGSISFREVDKLFRVFKDDQKYENLAKEIRLFTLRNDSTAQAPDRLINRRIEQIQQYYKLHSCIDAARIILDFKTSLGLQGNFQLVEDLHNQMNSEFKQRPLKTMNAALQEAGRLLSRVSPDRACCLDAVTKCRPLITWLKDTISGPQELKVLVDLAIISAGETDVETARITCLHTSCLGFAPLIFDLKPSFGFDELMRTCEPVWSAVDTDPKLPQKLIDTSRHMEWLQSVKTSHGSVAMSSLMEAQTINEKGIYCVGCLNAEKSSSIVLEQLTLDNVIRLTVPTGTNGKTKEYTLDGLKDLQSKLMLIAAKASQGKEEVDRFVDILQCVLRLATVYTSLCKAGEVSHLKWRHEFQCTPKLSTNRSLTNELINESEQMEQCLQQWKDELHAKRLQYSELNHFTTRQLLFLRSKLAVVRGRGPRAVDGIPLEVYNLLESVLPGIDPATLKSVLTFCGICCQEAAQNITRSYGATNKSQRPSYTSDKPGLSKKPQPSNTEMFQSLVAKLELLGYSEEVALAAMISCKDASEADLIVWSVQNSAKEDLISAKYSEALNDPRYSPLVNRDSTTSWEQESHSEEDMADEPHHSSEPMEASITLDQTADGEFLSLDELGKLLLHLTSQGSKKGRRRYPRYVKRGKPNFVVVPKDDIFGTVLSLYMHDTSQSLPTSEEVLICTSDTTAEEIELLWRRSLGDHDGRLFCLVNVDLLDYSVSQKAADALGFLLQEPQYNRDEGLSLVVICSSENEDRAHMAAALDQYRLGTIPHCATPKEIRQYLKTQFKPQGQQRGRFRDRTIPWTPAAALDKEGLAVRVLSSERAGAGKSLVVRRLSESLPGLKNNDAVMDYLRDMETDVPLCISVPIYGPFVHQCVIAESLLPNTIVPDFPLSRIFHLDVHPSVTNGLDTLLFNLLVLGVLKSSSGQVWRRRSSDLYVIELTSGTAQNETVERRLQISKRVSSKKVVAEPFYRLLPTIHCGTPMQTLFQLRTNPVAGNSLNPLFDNGEFQSSHVQRAFQYLKLWESAGDSLDHFWFLPGQVMGDHAECIETLTRNCGIEDPSWAELRHFVNFLNSQLQACEESSFCNMELVGDTLEGFRSFVVGFMILMSRDFATPSLNSCEKATDTYGEDGHANIDDEGATAAEVMQFSLRRHWETSSHPYIFFNQDRITMTFVGFHIDQNGNLIDPDRHVIIQRSLMSRHLRTGLYVQKVDMETNYESWSKGEKIQKLCGVMGVEWPYDPDDSYELTTDNLKKILAIHMRFRCGIPVVIMGETGCGKTCLIRYMCGLQSGPGGPKNMLLMKVHGGTTYKDIEKKVVQAEEMARVNEAFNIDTVLFFDEANTTDALGMIKEVMVDRRVNGRKIGVGLKRLQFIAACNPYRKHTEEMIHKLESAGLGYHVETQQTHDRLGHIPLRHLVYRVHSLPESMRPLVWDFGQLKPEIEEMYTRQIVSRFVLQEKKIPGEAPLVKALTAVLTASQRYMREQTDECSFVSLRDVERAMNVMVWFYNHREALNPLMDDDQDEESDDDSDGDSDDEEDTGEQDEMDQPLDDVTRALVLSLGVCYQARLQDREPYRRAVAQSFSNPCQLPGGHRRILQEITRCQKAVLNELELGHNIARNTALSENVFMMVVCIELRIPLFVVGKPGSSKSLAKTVVADNMEGDASRSDLFKTFKQVHMVSYQCSPLSTAEGIMATFRQCSKLQNGKNPDKYVSVVVLDEVGLAEDSPLMPLKTLHPLLEDGVNSTDDIIQVEEQFPERVAFIGISNWALDPAKMNRGIMLSRGLPDEEELVESAMGICSTDKRIQSFVAPLMNPLAMGYKELYDTQRQSKTLQESKKDEFFGLRDFYSLVKMVYKLAEEHGREPRWPEIEHAIRRNFGGLDEIDPVDVFKRQFKQQFSLGGRDRMRQKEDDFSAVNLIKASLERQISRGESRYLLVLTENYAALPIVHEELLKKRDDPVIIFGSSFPKDQEYTQVCRNINRIKVCMETGRTVILLNLESLYESLYDALNQYYVYFGGQKFVDLGLGSHRVKCRVHDEFRLIVIAERDVVYSKFPIPLINRLEKHYLVTSASLSSAQRAVVDRLHDWVIRFSHVSIPRYQQMRKYLPGDAFVGYHGDTAASVVLQVCSNMDQNEQQNLLSDDHSWEEEVFKESHELLLQCATPDAVARLPCTQLAQRADNLWATYFTVQEHSSLTAFLRNVLTTEQRRSEKGTLIQVTTHSRLLSSNDLQDISASTSLPLSNVTCLSLQQFHTEQQFCSSVRDFFAKLGGREGLLIVQCDAGDLSCNLIPCARHLLVEQRTTAEQDFLESVGHNPSSFVHVVLIVQLPRLVGGCPTFTGFQGGRWISVHIDELRPPTGQIPAIQFMVDRSVSELFDVAPSTTQVDDMEVEEEQDQEAGTDIDMETTADVSSRDTNLDKVDIVSLLRSCVQAAVARIDDESCHPSRSTRRIELMLSLLPDCRSTETDLSFATILARRIHKLLQEKDERAGSKASDWLRSEALSGTGIQENGTFRKALWQRVYSSVIPILSEVIGFVDRDSNLELVADEGNWLSQLWMQLFQSHSMAELHYDGFLSLESGIIRERVPVITSGHERQVFDLQFPFSWLIKEKFDGMWKEACSISARTNTPVQQCLQDLASASEMGRLLEEAEYEGYEESAVLRYLHDFVHMVHKPIVPEEEKLISQAIVTAAHELHAELDSADEFGLTISLIHVVYNDRIEKRLTNFCQLVRAQPDIVTRLLQLIPPNESEMVLDAVALRLCLSNLEPSEEEFADPQTRLVWCNRVLSIRSSADNMISNLSQYGPKTARILHNCRFTWQRVSAVRLFIEHTCPGTSVCHPADIKNAFKLWKALGDETDFTKPHTMQVIEKFLVDCSEAVSKRYTSYGVNTCPVCLEGLAGKDPVKMPCGHVICLVCVSHWIERERTCPLCKQDVPDDFKILSTKFVRKAVQEHYDFRRRCNSFFMELVSLFCFGAKAGDGVMDPEVFTMLMSYVIRASSKTKDFSPFPEHGIDATPVVRSFLLQQLLRTGDKEVKEHLAHYLSEARGLRPEMDHLLQVCQLFVHCWEDSLISLYSKTSGNLLVMIKLAQHLCDECTPLLSSNVLQQRTRELDVIVLEGVAKARYALALAAEFMYKSAVEDTSPWNDLQIRNELRTLFEGVKRMCDKSLSPVPRLYLLKQLVRRFGVESIHVLCGLRVFEWIVPPENRDKQQEDLVPDWFVIYGEDYKTIREAMAKTVLSATQKELNEALHSTALPPVVRDVMMLLSEYREVTTCYGFTSTQRQLSAKAQQCFQEFLNGDAHLSDRVKPFAIQLLNNTQGAAGFPGVRVAPGRSALEQNLAEIVIHTTAVLQCINQMTVCEPLRLLMDNPAALMNAFFPTMPDDNLQEAMAGMRESGSWYQCPKGHPYYIGDCGRPVEVKICPECKVNIGGAGYNLSQGNTAAQRADRTMTGHMLGHPSTRPKSLAPERNLSPVVVGIVRVLMHSAMIEGACRQPQGLSALINPRVPPAALSRFLWDHLQMDVEVLASSLGRSIDDTILCIHMVLVQMTARVSNPQQAINVAYDLKSKQSRRDWETAFSASVVTPVLTNPEQQIQRCLEMLVGDKRLGNNPLMRQLYEVDVPSEALTDSVPPTCPALWRYRTQVTLDHFSHTFQQEVLSTDNERNKVLAEFLRQEHKLRALRFLPDIVKLQRLLMDKFHRRIDRAEAERIKIRDFLRKIPSKTEKDELASLIASFNIAWNHVRLSLDQQGRLRPPTDLCEKPMDNTRPLALLLPSTSGMGICSTALVFFLTSVNNDFNERYQNLIGGKVKDLPHIQLQDVTNSNLISYDIERDLLPLILAQCNYSLEVGRGTLVQYNWEALERQLIDRFIRGRPMIDFKDERFAFSKDIQLDSVFASVKAKVHPQVSLSSAVSHQILGEFRSLTDICDVLSSLDIAIGFLSSTGGSPDMLLNHYLQRVLRMPQNSLRSLKAQQCCQLRHVISLWRLLSLERARILMRRGEDPFEQIADTYKHVMSQKQMMKFSNAMRRIDLDRFVSEVLELILLNLRGDAASGEEDMSLSEYIEWHLENKGHEPVPGLDELPADVHLKHVINAWRTSVELWDSYHDKRDSASA